MPYMDGVGFGDWATQDTQRFCWELWWFVEGEAFQDDQPVQV